MSKSEPGHKKPPVSPRAANYKVMPLDVYYTLGSTPCHSVLLLLKYMDLDANLRPVSLEQLENRTEQFLKMNPQFTVPTVNDNGFALGESRAILGYLVDTYASDDLLYPKDIKQRAIVNQRLFFEAGTLDKAFWEYFHGKAGKLFDALDILERYLEGKKWIAGDNKTIADFSLVSSVASIEAAGFDVGKYPIVANWYQRAQKTFPGYDQTVRAGCDVLKSYLNTLNKL